MNSRHAVFALLFFTTHVLYARQPFTVCFSPQITTPPPLSAKTHAQVVAALKAKPSLLKDWWVESILARENGAGPHSKALVKQTIKTLERLYKPIAKSKLNDQEKLLALGLARTAESGLFLKYPDNAMMVESVLESLQFDAVKTYKNLKPNEQAKKTVEIADTFLWLGSQTDVSQGARDLAEVVSTPRHLCFDNANGKAQRTDKLPPGMKSIITSRLALGKRSPLPIWFKP